jgi:hypothetical protein
MAERCGLCPVILCLKAKNQAIREMGVSDSSRRPSLKRIRV